MKMRRVEAKVVNMLHMTGKKTSTSEISDTLELNYPYVNLALNRMTRIGSLSFIRRGRHKYFYLVGDYTGLLVDARVELTGLPHEDVVAQLKKEVKNAKS